MKRSRPKANPPRKVKAEKAVFLADIHAPHEDPLAIDLALDFTSWFQPDTVFLMGDVIDFLQISRFDRDPVRVTQLQDDLDKTRALLERLRGVAKKSTIIYIDGNHEARLRAFTWSNPALVSLKNMTLPKLLDLPSLSIEHHEYHEVLEWHGLLVEHGDRVSKHSGTTAKNMLEARGRSGISGHVHRAGVHFRTDYDGTKVWYESPCLCSLKPDWTKLPNWQSGFSVGYGIDNRFFVEVVPIVRYRILYGGMMWERKAK